MNKRGLKTRTPLSNAVKTELFNQLKTLSEESEIPISRLLDRAIILLLNEYHQQKR